MSRRVRFAAALALVLAIGLATWVFQFSGNGQVQRRQDALLQSAAAPTAVPDLAFVDAKGERRSLADFRGRYVLLNVWATWCVPCREEMPALDRLQARLGGPDFTVLALSVDSGGAQAVKPFFSETGVRSLDIYVDPSLQAISALRIPGVPATVLVDRQGREIGRHLGPAAWDGERALEELRGRIASD